VVAILREVSDWLAARGIAWMVSFPGPVAEKVNDGQVWLAAPVSTSGTSEAIATLTVDADADVELWGEPGREAGYVHRLAVARNFAGVGIGAALLEFASDQVARWGMAWLRLDCNKDNEELQNYYRRNGFSYLRTIDLPHRISGALFEKPARRNSGIELIEAGHYRISCQG
jgi:ribosomal protein S18 acetylase RimI-like enzyme